MSTDWHVCRLQATGRPFGSRKADPEEVRIRNKHRTYEGPKRRRDGSKNAVLRSLQEEGLELVCQICGEDRAFDMAHIVDDRHGGPMEADNILLLCPNHHRFFGSGSLEPGEWAVIREKVETARRRYGGQNAACEAA